MENAASPDAPFDRIYAAYLEGRKLDKPDAVRSIGREMARAEFGTIYGRLPTREELHTVIAYVACTYGKNYPYTPRPVIA